MKASLLPALAATAAGVWVLFKVLIPAAPPLAIEIVSSRQCLECHAEVAAEWQASHHAFAYRQLISSTAIANFYQFVNAPSLRRSWVGQPVEEMIELRIFSSSHSMPSPGASFAQA